MPRKIEVSHRTIIFTVFFLILLWFLYFIRELILELFVALLLMTLLNPLVTRLSKYKIPRGLSTFLVYLLSIVVLVFIFAGIIPPLVEQTTSFVNGMPRYLANLGLSSNIAEQLSLEAISLLGQVPSQLAKFAISVLSNLLSVFTVLVFAFYLLISREKLEDQLGFLFGDKRNSIGKAIDLLEKRMGGWARGQISLMFLIGVVTYLGLILVGIPFALPLSLLAGIFEIIPYVGPILAAIPAILIGFGISPVSGIATFALYFLIQQIENYVFVPKVMEKSVGISPIVTLFVLSIGFRIAGVSGAIISVPLVIAIQTIMSKHFSLFR